MLFFNVPYIRKFSKWKEPLTSNLSRVIKNTARHTAPQLKFLALKNCCPPTSFRGFSVKYVSVRKNTDIQAAPFFKDQSTETTKGRNQEVLLFFHVTSHHQTVSWQSFLESYCLFARFLENSAKKCLTRETVDSGLVI